MAQHISEDIRHVQIVAADILDMNLAIKRTDESGLVYY